jgi:hypothetical protein
MPEDDVGRILDRVEGLMDDLQAWLIEREDDARSSGDRDAAQRWRQRRLRLRAYRQGLVTIVNEETQPEH